jgi:hypothetical protein
MPYIPIWDKSDVNKALISSHVPQIRHSSDLQQDVLIYSNILS